jgi:hypothetical protein
MRFAELGLVLLFASFSASAVAQTAGDSSASAIELFNGQNLDGLAVYVDDVSIEPTEVWKVEDGMLRCTGIGKGYVRTDKAYADYKLHVEWRWPRGPGNSGVLLNLVGDDVVWPKSFEAQLKADRAGDFALFADARSNEEIVSRNPQGVSTGRLVRPGASAENPLGEWNTYEAVVAGDTITLWVNGVKVNRMTGVQPSAGMIGLQSEGTPIDFRNFTLTPLPPAKDLNAPMPK